MIRDRLAWLIPVGVGAAVLALSTHDLSIAVGLVLALLLVAYFVKRPGTALITLIIFLPFQLIGFSLLFAAHVPAAFLKPASSFKELLALSILLAGIRQIRDSGRRLDRIDAAVLAYVAVVTIYLVVPHLFSSYAPTQWNVRLLAWRSDAAYPLVFFGVRHAAIPPRYKERFIRVLMVLGFVVAGIALFQRIAPTIWSTFVLHTAGVPAFESHVVGLSSTDVLSNLRYIYTITPLRTSSLFFSPFDMGDFLVLVCAVVGVRIRGGHRSAFNYVVLGASLGALFFSRSRSDGLAVVIILLLIVLPTSRHQLEGRLRLIGALALGALLLVPALGGSRFVGAQGGNASAVGHVQEIKNGLSEIRYLPLGLGLGDQPGTSQRSLTAADVPFGGNVSDNLILQVGDELGLQALLPWLAMMILVLWELKRRAGLGDSMAASLGFGLLGVVIAGLYHHVFLSYPVPWTLWAGAGLALSVTRQSYEETQATNVYPSVAGVP